MNLKCGFVETPSNGRVLQGFNSDENFWVMYKKNVFREQLDITIVDSV